MTYTLAICTTNTHKIQEITHIFKDIPLNIVSIYSLFDDSIVVEETGNSFDDNAILKVEAFPETKGVILLGEDSGLVVNALNGAPGIYSARYAGHDSSSEALCQKVLSRLGNAPNRGCYFHCSIAIKWPVGFKDSPAIQLFQGKALGRISHIMKGDKGFGYDPIFIPDGFSHTFGERGGEHKHQLSHRFIALRKIIPFMKSLLAQKFISS